MDTEQHSAMRPDPLDDLRRMSRVVHERVDEAFSAFDLAIEADYMTFLRAHAAALPAAEAFLARCPLLPSWTLRGELLSSDLNALGAQPVAPLPLVLQPETPEGWGVLYVLEGSRLGGRMLAKRVAPDLPSAYLSAAHGKGEWAEFLRAFGAFLGGLDDQAHDRVRGAVIAAFDLFRRGAEQVSESR